MRWYRVKKEKRTRDVAEKPTEGAEERPSSEQGHGNLERRQYLVRRR